ncbi:MAG: hypothetical protein MJY76_00015 [Bacteroidales bacterium]|nr:hypothetical protein [Bacteroidales bacterium]
MKKIVMIFAAMAAVLSSCSKSELESGSANENKDIILNISVSNPGASDTKALIKQGWEVNDQIKIWFDERTTSSTPDLVIKYDGSNWTQDGTAVFTPTSASGNVKAVYKNTVIVASKDAYTLSGNTLTFDIKNWKFLTELQVVVKGLTSASAGSYTLACDKFTPLASTGDGYTVGSDAITASNGTKGDAVTGISNTDGVAFVFATADYSATAAAFKFTLKDNTSGSVVTKEYKPNVAIAAKDGKQTIKALTIASSNFQKAVPEGFVDLGLPSGILWAEKNLGATKPEEYGTYFQWGGTTGHECNGTTTGSTFKDSYKFQWSNTPFHSGTSSSSGWTKYIPSDKSSYWSGSGDPDNKLVLESDDDAAYQANNSWRMPTSKKFVELFTNCYAEWGTYNSVNGLIVYKVKDESDKGYAYFNNKMNQYSGSGNSWNTTSKARPTGYSTTSDTFVFFPAAGYGGGTSLNGAGSRGYYWSSSLYSSNPYYAYYLYFNSSYVGPQCNGSRYGGFSVRPVSD